MTPYIWQSDNLTQALKALNPIWHGHFTAQSTRITTDTRTMNAGDIFLAIQGDNFDKDRGKFPLMTQIALKFTDKVGEIIEQFQKSEQS